MSKLAPKLNWCIVRLGKDLNWWVSEISDKIHWDLDGLSIIDPKQFAHILELLEPFQEYGFKEEMFQNAFFAFKIEKLLEDKRVRLLRTDEQFYHTQEKLFLLPDLIDEEKSAYADFLDHITRIRVNMLNDLIHFESKLTIEEIEETLRNNQNQMFMEGRGIHIFEEITNILEYIPKGYDLGDDSISGESDEDENYDDLEDVEVEEDEKDISLGDLEEGDDENFEDLDDLDDEDDDLDDEDEDDDFEDDEDDDLLDSKKKKKKSKVKKVKGEKKPKEKKLSSKQELPAKEKITKNLIEKPIKKIQKKKGK